MPRDYQPVEDLLGPVIEVAHRAGEIAAGWQGRTTTHLKADGSYATEADVAVEDYCREAMQGLFPGDRILGEESPPAGPLGGERAWVIDPLDGTHNYVAGLDLWAVSLGLVDAGRPQAGVVVVPPLGMTFAAVAGRGAWLDGKELPPLGETTLAPNDLVGASGEKACRVEMPGKLRNLGSAALVACLVTAGVMKAAYFHYWALWDLAAALCLAGETGVEARRPGGELLDDLAGIEVAARQGLLVMARRGQCEPLAQALAACVEK
jgi:myo-inositol-1(or 4)-monophosphatase